MLVLLAQNGVSACSMQLPKSYHPSYIKNTVVPFVSILRIQAENIPVFGTIQYNNGQASISYDFSSYIKKQFVAIQSEVLENGNFAKTKGYIIVNIDEFLSLKGLYTKQLYLVLCAWQKEQLLDIYRTGERSIFKLWQLPKSYEKCLVAKILKPSIDKINALTSLHIVKIACYKGKLSLVYKRLAKKQKQRTCSKQGLRRMYLTH